MITHHNIPSLRRRPDGRIATTSITNELAEAINAGAHGGRHGQLHQHVNLHSGFWAKVVRTGPLGSEDDYMDDRYWLKASRVANIETGPKDENISFERINDSDSEDFQVVVASNLAEGTSRGHIIPMYTVVWVDAVEDKGDPTTVRYVFSCGTPEIWMKITSSTVVAGTTNRWAYRWTQQQYLRAGAFQDFPGALTNATADYGGLAYNMHEAFNSASGMQGNSINLATLPAGFTIKPVRGNPVVRAYRVFSCDVPEVSEWLFQYENAVEGTCP